MQAHVQIKETTWRDEARKWGQLFKTIYQNEDVTPYIHVFIYHVGLFYLEHYQGIEKFATYALESKHSENKRVVNSATNKALHGAEISARQQLQAQVRHNLYNLQDQREEEERSASGDNLSVAKSMGRKSRRRAHPQWAEASLAIAAKYKDYIVSSDQTSSIKNRCEEI